MQYKKFEKILFLKNSFKLKMKTVYYFKKRRSQTEKS